MYWLPSSPGDIADRWTILKLKMAKAASDEDLRVCARRLEEMRLPAYDETAMALVEALARVHARLWDLEDAVRALLPGLDTPEGCGEFVAAARGIPLLNDVRAHLKRRIDECMGYTDVQDPKFH